MPIVLLLVIGTSIWVGVDAGGRDWSNSTFAKSPAAWVLGCLLLWIVVFPIYLVQRSSVPLKSDGAMQRGLAASGASALSDRVWMGSGHRYLLGYTISAPIYGIWDHSNLSLPAHRFPYSEHGKAEASKLFEQLEPRAESVISPSLPAPPFT